MPGYPNPRPDRELGRRGVTHKACGDCMRRDPAAISYRTSDKETLVIDAMRPARCLAGKCSAIDRTTIALHDQQLKQRETARRYITFLLRFANLLGKSYVDTTQLHMFIASNVPTSPVDNGERPLRP
jgi:hypothetical protein